MPVKTAVSADVLVWGSAFLQQWVKPAVCKKILRITYDIKKFHEFKSIKIKNSLDVALTHTVLKSGTTTKMK